MISYRRFEGHVDEDLDGVTTVEREVEISTCYAYDTVSSYDQFKGRFPDASQRDCEAVARLFYLNPNMWLTVRPKAG